jgi:hypothetical protein
MTKWTLPAKETFVLEQIEFLNENTVRAVLVQVGRSKRGRLYTSEVLQASVSLFDQVPFYVDHPIPRTNPMDGKLTFVRSRRDLSGLITQPEYGVFSPSGS